MRFILFYSDVEIFNHFSDCIARELESRGHAAFLLDLTTPDHEGCRIEDMEVFLAGGLDGVICYDRLGSHVEELKNLWSSLQVTVFDIFVDPPSRFTEISSAPPARYIQFCCDREHVQFQKRFFPNTLKDVSFLPHFGTVDEEPVIPFAERPYDIVFSGTYYAPQVYLDEIDREYPITTAPGKVLYMTLEYLLAHPESSVYGAIDAVNRDYNLNLGERGLLLIATISDPVDWYVRMLYRGMAIEALAGAGLELYLTGRGWENLECTKLPNVHRLSDRVPFADSLRDMRKARINFNILPWFKDGTHERIFNTLLRDSMPLTNDSLYLREHFTDGVDLRYYSLKELQRLPEIATDILTHPDEAERVIAHGKETALAQYTWKNCVDALLEKIS